MRWSRSWPKPARMRRTITGGSYFARVICTPTLPGMTSSFSTRTVTLENLRMRQHHRGDALGERFHQMNMTLRDDVANALGDQVVGEHLVQPLRRAGRPRHAGIDGKAHLLRRILLAVERADAHRQHEVMHEDAVGRGVGFFRIGHGCDEHRARGNMSGLRHR